jgi:hypothetical protein
MHNDYLASTNVVTNASGTPIRTLDYMPGALRLVRIIPQITTPKRRTSIGS